MTHLLKFHLPHSKFLSPLPFPLITLPALRIATLLFLIVLLNFMDLNYTLFANGQGMLTELNPIAANLFSMELAPSVICFKALTCLLGTALLWRLRRSPWTLPSCWLLVAVYAALAVRWFLWTQTYVEMMQTTELCRITAVLRHHV